MLLEFGMRRGHDRGVNAGARAALIGGAHFSSNAGISHVLGFDPKGTHAHSMVQMFLALGGSELYAFQAYADVYPHDCLLLVDTINTLESGIPNAIRVFEGLRKKGHRPVGIRLDSGDLAYLSVQAARLLNEAGFEETVIVLSNDLDEITILQIINQIQEEAAALGMDADAIIKRLVYGVGTRLITSLQRAALDGVYKLVAVQDEGGQWQPAIKISENPVKIPNPDQKQVWRVYDQRGIATADLICLDEEDPAGQDPLIMRHISDHHKFRALPQAHITKLEPLLQPAFSDGKRVGEQASIEAMRKRRDSDLERVDVGVRRLINPHIYHVSLSEKLWKLKQRLIRETRQNEEGG
jgi:nicotinate phosphoribosyltransferase